MKTYEIAIFTRDPSKLLKPIHRILIPTEEVLRKFLAEHSPEDECSALICHYEDAEEDDEDEYVLSERTVFFGNVDRLIKQELTPVS